MRTFKGYVAVRRCPDDRGEAFDVHSLSAIAWLALARAQDNDRKWPNAWPLVRVACVEVSEVPSDPGEPLDLGAVRAEMERVLAGHLTKDGGR